MPVPHIIPARKSSRLLTVAVCAFSVGVAGCGGRLNLNPVESVDLSGQWQLNASLSDDPKAMLKARQPAGRQGRGSPAEDERPPGGERPAGGMGAPGGGMPGAGARGPGRAVRGTTIENYLVQPASLAVTQTPGEIRLVADGFPARFVYGQKVSSSSMSGVSERRSGWQENAFIVDEAVKDGPDISRRYEIADVGKQLIVTTDISGSRGRDLTFRTVYDRAAAQ